MQGHQIGGALQFEQVVEPRRAHAALMPLLEKLPRRLQMRAERGLRIAGKNADETRRLAFDQIPRRTYADDAAFVQHDDAVTQHLGFVHVVRGHEHRLAGVAQVGDFVPQQMAHGRIETGRGFIEDEQLRIREQRAHESEPPLHATREHLDRRFALRL